MRTNDLQYIEIFFDNTEPEISMKFIKICLSDRDIFEEFANYIWVNYGGYEYPSDISYTINKGRFSIEFSVVKEFVSYDVIDIFINFLTKMAEYKEDIVIQVRQLLDDFLNQE